MGKYLDVSRLMRRGPAAGADCRANLRQAAHRTSLAGP